MSTQSVNSNIWPGNRRAEEKSPKVRAKVKGVPKSREKNKRVFFYLTTTRLDTTHTRRVGEKCEETVFLSIPFVEEKLNLR